MFEPRLMYDGETGEYAEIPDIDKHTDKLKVRLDLPMRTTVYGAFVYSNTNNNEIDKEYDTTVYALRVSTMPIRNLKVSLKGRYYTIDNDDVHVDLSKWSNDDSFDGIYQSWGATDASYFNYQRKSVLDRDVWEAGLDLRYNFSKYYVRAGYEYKYIDRDNSEWKDYDNDALRDDKFLDDETTKIHTLKVTLGGHPLNQLNFRLAYKYIYQQDPFENHNGIGLDVHMRELYSDHIPLNGYGGVPYFLIFRNWNRTKDATNVPTDTHDLKLTADWSPFEKLTVSLNGEYKYQKNDDSDWKGETYVGGINFMFYPIEKVVFNAGAQYEYDTYETRMCVDLFGG